MLRWMCTAHPGPDDCRVRPFSLQLHTLSFFWLFQNIVFVKKVNLIIVLLSRHLISSASVVKKQVMFWFCVCLWVLKEFQGLDSSRGLVFLWTFLWLWWSATNRSRLQTSKHKDGKSPQHTHTRVCETSRAERRTRFLPSCSLSRTTPAHWHNTDWRKNINLTDNKNMLRDSKTQKNRRGERNKIS